jgi:hypothetical protein
MGISEQLVCVLMVPSAPISDRLPSPESSSFTHLAAKGQFVDKGPTLLDFLQAELPVHLLIRPRRSGILTLLPIFR